MSLIRKFFIFAWLCFFLLMTGVLFSINWNLALHHQRDHAKQQLLHYRNALLTELQHYEHLNFILTQDPLITRSAQYSGQHNNAINTRLARIAAEVGAEAIYLMNRSGLTVAASNAQQEETFLGQNYAFRPYFQRAIQGQKNRYYAVGVTTRKPGYFFAHPVKSETQDIVGVLTVKISLLHLERFWREEEESIFLSNQDGVILLSSEPAWLYHTLGSLPPALHAKIAREKQFANLTLEPLGWRKNSPEEVHMGQRVYSHFSEKALPHGWQLHLLGKPASMIQIALQSLVFPLGLSFFLLLLIAIRRNLRINSALTLSESQEAKLREANTRLNAEMEEHRHTARRLFATQSELNRIEKLAVLGQMAASVVHELGQPLVAMRNRLATAEIQKKTQQQETTTRASRFSLEKEFDDLVARMESILKNLKTFSRPTETPMKKIDLNQIIQESLALLESNILEQDIHVDNRLSARPIPITAHRYQLGQAITNLLRNAIDAMRNSTEKTLSLTVGETEGCVRLSIADTGCGLRGLSVENLKEPFVSQNRQHRERHGENGMGLGLTISQQILSAHNVTLTARDREKNGAEFVLVFPRNPA